MEFFTFGLMIFMIIYLLIYRSFELDPISKSMTLILVAMSLTSVIHWNITDLIEVGSFWLYFMIAYVFFKYLLHDIPIKYTFAIIVFTALYPSLNQLYTIILHLGIPYLGYVRYAGTYRHPLIVSYYLFMAIPAVIYLFIKENNKRYRAIYIAVIAIFHLGIFFSFYRTIWISILVFWSCYIMVVSKRKIASLALTSIIAFVIWQLIGDILISRLMGIKTIFQNPGIILSFDSYEYNMLFSGRMGIWKTGLEAYFQSSWLEKVFGLGLNSVSKLSFTYMHNEYLSAIVETGIIGLICFSIWISIVIKVVLNYARTNKIYAYLILAVVVSFLVTAMGTMPFRNIRILNYMAIYLATIGSFKEPSVRTTKVLTKA